LNQPKSEWKSQKLRLLRFRPSSESLRLRLTHSHLSTSLTRKMFLRSFLSHSCASAKVCPPLWPKWSSSSRCARKELLKMLYPQHLTRLVSSSGESSWRNRKSESGIREKRTSRGFKMRD